MGLYGQLWSHLSPTSGVRQAANQMHMKERQKKRRMTSMLIDLIAICAESVCLSAGSNLELSMVHKDYQVSSIASNSMHLLM